MRTYLETGTYAAGTMLPVWADAWHRDELPRAWADLREWIMADWPADSRTVGMVEV